MRFNSKILYAIISLAFVGGMFTSVYAGPILPTITLAGNVHTTGDSVVDGDLSVGGVSFAALDLRIAALETSTVPMVLANEAMITTHGNTLTTQGNMLTTHDTTLTTHDGMILSNAGDIATNDAMISSNQADIAANAAAIEAGGGGGVICDTNGDGGVDPQEMLDYVTSQGVTALTFQQIFNTIGNIEQLIGSQNVNGVLDTPEEMNEWNVVNIFYGIPICPLPGGS